MNKYRIENPYNNNDSTWLNAVTNDFDEVITIQAGTKYKQEFWKIYNSFPLTSSEQKFINSIKSN